MVVPSSVEMQLERGLANMLIFNETHFTSGKHISDYTFELDGGISEIYVHTDVVRSSHVGDSFCPILKVIPCASENSDQIVKRYETPIYFPLKSNLIQEISIDLRSTAGANIIFAGGKTFGVLSFRRKRKKFGIN